MDKALISILCDQEHWTFSTYSGYFFKISFKNNGTGELWAVGELGWGWVFALNFEWEDIHDLKERIQNDVSNVDSTRSEDNIGPQPLGSLEIKITLTQTRADSAQEIPAWRMSDTSGQPILDKSALHNLTEAAFRPRTFVVTIEKGNFSHDEEYGWGNCYSRERWGLRLIFDNSPYPPLESWTQVNGFERVEAFRHRRVAVARRLPEGADKDKPMDDDSYMGYLFGDIPGKIREGVMRAYRTCAYELYYWRFDPRNQRYR